jgi:hypothetical protein
MKIAVSALFDLKSITKGRSLFKRKKYVEIIRRQDDIMMNDPLASQLGAFQKASKELWQEADQDKWERDASLEHNEDSIFELSATTFYKYMSIHYSLLHPETRRTFPSISITACALCARLVD